MLVRYVAYQNHSLLVQGLLVQGLPYQWIFELKMACDAQVLCEPAFRHIYNLLPVVALYYAEGQKVATTTSNRENTHMRMSE